MILGLAEPKKPHWVHVDFCFGVNGGHDSSEGTGECNGRRYYKWHTDG